MRSTRAWAARWLQRHVEQPLVDLQDRHDALHRPEVVGGGAAGDLSLDEAERREEIARMLSGASITAEARAAAARLLEGAG